MGTEVEASASAILYGPSDLEILEAQLDPVVLVVRVAQSGLYHPYLPCLPCVRDVHFFLMDLRNIDESLLISRSSQLKFR